MNPPHRSSSVESINSQRGLGATNKAKKKPLRLSNEKSNGSLKSNGATTKSSKSYGGSAARSSLAEKENVAAAESSLNSADDTLQETMDDASLPVDPDNEMAEIDARLNALQNFMKSMGHD